MTPPPLHQAVWSSFFPLPTCSERAGISVSCLLKTTTGGEPTSRDSMHAHQQKMNAHITSCQWRLMAMSFLTWYQPTPGSSLPASVALLYPTAQGVEPHYLR